MIIIVRVIIRCGGMVLVVVVAPTEAEAIPVPGPQAVAEGLQSPLSLSFSLLLLLLLLEAAPTFLLDVYIPFHSCRAVCLCFEFVASRTRCNANGVSNLMT